MAPRACLALLLSLLTVSAADARAHRPSALPGATEVLRFLGTEPFWGGALRGQRMTLDWPENEKGVTIRVGRREVRGRLVVIGVITKPPHFMDAGRFTMTVVRKSCSDGMSDRTYPYEVVLGYGDGRQLGCGWTARRPFRELPEG